MYFMLDDEKPFLENLKFEKLTAESKNNKNFMYRANLDDSVQILQPKTETNYEYPTFKKATFSG